MNYLWASFIIAITLVHAFFTIIVPLIFTNMFINLVEQTSTGFLLNRLSIWILFCTTPILILLVLSESKINKNKLFPFLVKKKKIILMFLLITLVATFLISQYIEKSYSPTFTDILR